MSSPYKKAVSFMAELITGAKSYDGFIENFSGNDIFMRTFPMTTAIDFNPGTIVEVKFHPPTGKTLCLNCRLKWSYKTPPYGLTNSIGMEIISLLPDYENFLKGLL